MAKYTGTVLTNKGKELLARAILGEAIVFTKVEIGKGILSPGADKETLTSLVTSFKILSITSTTKLANGGYRIRISFNNKGFIDDTYLREVGVYAKGEDGAEILYSYCNTDTPNLIPSEPSGKIEIVEDIITYISSAATITAVVDQSNVYATIKDLIEGLATKENKFSKNGAFNKNFGTTTGTIMEGDKRAIDLGGEAAFNKKDAFNKSFSHVISSTSKILVASAYAVKLAYDKGATALTKATSAQSSANSAQTKANQAYTLADGKESKFSKKSGFNLDITHVVNSTSKTLVASALAVKTAYDKGVAALNKANSAYALASGKEPKFSKKSGFNLDITHVVNSTSKTLVASALAVKTAYDKGVAALNKANSAYTLASGKEPKFSKKSAFNKNFGTGSNDIPRGNHSHSIDHLIGCPHGVKDYWITESTSNPATKWTGTTWTKLEGRVLLGTSSGYALGTQSGRSTVALTLANIASHTHGFSGTTNTKGNHYHQGGNHRHKVDNHAHTEPTHEHNLLLGTHQSSSAAGLRNSGGSGGIGGTASSSTYGTYSNRDTKNRQLLQNGGGANTGGASPYTNYQNPNTSTTGNHNHTISGTTGSNGSGSAFNIMNPYRVVNIWRRTA